MNVLILAANGQIAQIVEKRLLTEPDFKDIHLTLGLRRPSRLANLRNSAKLLEVDLTNASEVDQAMEHQDIVLVAVVDHTSDNIITKNVIAAMKKQQVKRVIFANILGLYNEVPGEFGRWNHEQVAAGLKPAINSDKLLADSGLNYTTLRLPWLNDRDEIKYTITTRNEPYMGVSGSRKSIADVIVRIIADPSLYANNSIGIADPDTKNEIRPVY